jgi:hypothetical protein
MKKLPRKRRTREHVIADLSVNHVERFALLCGFVSEHMRYDTASTWNCSPSLKRVSSRSRA